MALLVSVAAFVYGLGVLAGAILSGLVVGTLGVLPFVVIPRGRREAWTRPAARFWARGVLAMLAVRPDVRGRLDLRRGEGALVICNHRSWVDPVMLMAATGANGLSKSQIFWIPFVGFYGWLAGAVFFDRTSARGRERARQEVLSLALAGHRIQVFPEGTRSRDGRLKEQVYLRLIMDCHSRGIAVVPCAISGGEDALPPARWGAWPGRRVRLEIGPTLRPREAQSATAFARAAWDQVREQVSRLHDEALTNSR